MKRPLFTTMTLIALVAALGGCSVPISLPIAALCPGNLLQNGDFAAGIQRTGDGSMPPSLVSDWTAAFETPQIYDGAGCGNPGFISMWGNQVVGEGIRQTLSAPLVQGRTYRFSACVRWLDNNLTVPQYVRFKVRTSTGYIVNYTDPAALVGTIGETASIPPPTGLGITSTNWSTVTLQDWVATGAFNWITINPENALSINDGSQVSWGQIDNACLLEVPCDLSISKQADPIDVVSLAEVALYITVKNVGTAACAPPGGGIAYKVTDTPPPGLLTFSPVPVNVFQPPPGPGQGKWDCQILSGSLDCNFSGGPLPAGHTATIPVRNQVTAPPGTQGIENCAFVSGDTITTNNKGCVKINTLP